jgi:hypothetical protein
LRGPTVYLERDPSGQRLVGLRLIGDQEEECYSVPEDASPSEAVRFAAEWIRARLDAKSGDGIGMLCLDPRGAVCSWLDVPSSDDSVIKAAVRQKPAGAWGEWTSMPAMAGSDAVESLVPVGAASLEALGDNPTKPAGQGLVLKKKKDPTLVNRRAAVLAMGDLPVRLMIDALDEMKIQVGQITSLWHAMASAWDPAAEARDNDDPLVSSAKVDTAIVLVEATGRVQWAWSDEGRLVTSGTAMIEQDAFAGDDKACSFGSGRLAMDWLAWTAQLGRSPRRVFCLIDTEHGSAAGTGAFGQAISKIWPSASVDLVPVEDPIISTFLRLQERTPGGKARRQIPSTQQMSTLANRPGRAHRGMYRWIAAAIMIGAVGLGVLGFKTRASGKDAVREAATISATTNSLILSELGQNADPMFAAMSLQTELDRLRAEGQNTDFTPIRPVLLALEEISFWLANMNGIELSSLTIDQAINLVKLDADSTASAEAAPGMLKNAQLINWNDGNIRTTASKTIVNIDGFWRDVEEEGGQ